MKISRKNLSRIIREEIEILNIRNVGQFGYIIQKIIGSPDEPISSDLFEPKKGKLILSKGQSFNEISPDSAYWLMRLYNIEANPDQSLRKPVSKKRKLKALQVPEEPKPLKKSQLSVQSVGGQLSSLVSGGSHPLRNDIEKIETDIRRGEIAVYLQKPEKRIATDQQIACALRNLLDNKINPAERYAINPCGFKDRAQKSLMMIVRL